ncbi:hypothetical protein BC830DRAFT_1100951 [Chytriomyces sp. MP71]|nr:hypothetical protein BC830DRAFT_1100951 [Chytriomyces sp. MP71]
MTAHTAEHEPITSVTEIRRDEEIGVAPSARDAREMRVFSQSAMRRMGMALDSDSENNDGDDGSEEDGAVIGRRRTNRRTARVQIGCIQVKVDVCALQKCVIASVLLGWITFTMFQVLFSFCYCVIHLTRCPRSIWQQGPGSGCAVQRVEKE